MRYILSVIGVILFIVVVIVIIAHAGVSSKKPVTPPITLDNYSNGTSSVTQITTGALVGEDERVAIEITVSQNERDLSILSGYEQTVTNAESFPNTPAAYKAFLEGLTNENFTKSRKTSEKDILGTCPDGNTFYYQLTNNTSSVSNLWSTSCSTGDGTFDGLGSNIRQLFQAQIPNYDAFTNNVNMNT